MTLTFNVSTLLFFTYIYCFKGEMSVAWLFSQVTFKCMPYCTVMMQPLDNVPDVFPIRGKWAFMDESLKRQAKDSE